MKLHKLIVIATLCLTGFHLQAEPAATTESPIGGVDHIGLTVSDLNKSQVFFTHTLGFKVLGEDPGYPAFFLNNGSITVTLWQAADDKATVAFNRKTNVGLHHLAFQVDSEQKLHALHQTLLNTPGVIVEFAPENLGAGPTKHMMIREPSGNRIEFIHRKG